MSNEALAAALKTHVRGTAENKIKGVRIVGPEAYDEMIKRLVDYYEDPAASIEAALSGLKKLRPVKEEDYRGLVSLVDEVESAYMQLTTWDQRDALTSRDVIEIMDLLPPSIKNVWLRIHQQLNQDEKKRPFPSFMKFLENERNTWSGPAERQPVTTSRKSSHFGSQSNFSRNTTA